MNTLPLFYYQPNYVDFLELSLKLNRRIFDDIIVLKNTNYPEFDSVYQHMSSNKEEFEKYCFYRFFNMLDYCKENNIQKFVYCDTDAIFLKKLDWENIIKDEECVLGVPDDQSNFLDAACSHFSIWTLKGLESFCNFILETYKSRIDRLLPKWNYHKASFTGGGICDMTLLYYWYKGNKNMFNLEEGIFDRAIGLIRNKLVKKDNQFYINNRQVLGLHFQGRHKCDMGMLL
jgi:lipopolysaccharide biosynthesis glycosyltransferase